MRTKQQAIESENDIFQAKLSDITPEERVAVETLARLNVARELAGLAPKASAANPKSCKRKPTRQLRQRRSRRKPALVSRPVRSSKAAHESRCSICRHEERAAIEEAFLHWQNPRDIQDDYRVQERAIYRHAHALGLFSIRSRNLRFALGNIIERTSRMYATPECIIRAAQVFAKIDDEGRWIEPPRRLIISREPAAVVAAVADATGVADLSAASRVQSIPAQPLGQLQAAETTVPADPNAAAPNTANRNILSPAPEPTGPDASSDSPESARPVWPKPAFVLDRSRFAGW